MEYDLNDCKRKALHELLKKYNPNASGGALCRKFRVFYETPICDKFFDRRWAACTAR